MIYPGDPGWSGVEVAIGQDLPIIQLRVGKSVSLHLSSRFGGGSCAAQAELKMGGELDPHAGGADLHGAPRERARMCLVPAPRPGPVVAAIVVVVEYPFSDVVTASSHPQPGLGSSARLSEDSWIHEQEASSVFPILSGTARADGHVNIHVNPASWIPGIEVVEIEFGETPRSYYMRRRLWRNMLSVTWLDGS